MSGTNGAVPLQVRSLSRSFGTFSLREISLEVRPAEYVAMVGPCGAGKTLLLETVAGFHEHGPGAILLHGEDVFALPPEKRELGLLCQGDSLFPHLSVAANIRFGVRYLTREGRAAAERNLTRLLALLGVERLIDRRETDSLSGGEKQLVALARALAPGPRLLLLDEPLHSLDVTFQRRAMAILARIPAETGVPVLHITHDLPEVAGVASRIVVLENGRVLQTGSLAELKRAPTNLFVAELAAADNLLKIPAGRDFVELDGSRLPINPQPIGTGALFVVLDPDRLRVSLAEDGQAGRVVAVREGPAGVEVVVATGENHLLARAGERPFPPEVLQLGAVVRIETDGPAVHAFRENVA